MFMEILILLSLLIGATICVDTAITVFTRNERRQEGVKNETTTRRTTIQSARPKKSRKRNS